MLPDSSGQGRFRILGRIQVRTGQGWREVSDPAWRSVLTVMLFRPGQVVPLSTLTGELWGDDPPPLAANLVALYVARLQQMIGDSECRVLARSPSGYLLHLQPGDLDAQCFEDLVAKAGVARADRDPLRATVLLQRALGLWRGEALAGVRLTPLTSAVAGRLAELHLTAMEMLTESDRACTMQVPIPPRLSQPMTDDILWERMREPAHSPSGHDKHQLAACEARAQVTTSVAGYQFLDFSEQLRTHPISGSNIPAATPRPAPVMTPSPIPFSPDGDQMTADMHDNPTETAGKASGPDDLAAGSAAPDAPGFDLCPNPLAAQTPAELVKVLSQFRIWAGEPSFREMERRCGHQVAASTICTALTSDKLPKLPIVQAILAACGASQEHHQAFTTAWRRIRMN